jgi:hypothetical protein
MKLAHLFGGFWAVAALAPVVGLLAQTPAGGPILNLTATTDNVSGAHDSVRIDLLRWSTDAERDQFLAAWNMTGPAGAAAPATGRGGRGGAAPEEPASEENPAQAGGNGAGRAGRGGGASAEATPGEATPAQANAAAGGRGGAGRAGRGGRGRGGAAAPPIPRTPEALLAAAIEKAPTVGYVWSSEVAGYAIRYAVRLPESGGGQRIILITDRRLGAWNDLWKPTTGTLTNYEFSVIELRLNAKGEGEGRTSLTGKVAVDGAAKTLDLEDYSALPVVFRNVKRKSS